MVDLESVEKLCQELEAFINSLASLDVFENVSFSCSITQKRSLSTSSEIFLNDSILASIAKLQSALLTLTKPKPSFDKTLLKEATLLSCGFCQRLFTTTKRLNRHITLKHPFLNSDPDAEKKKEPRACRVRSCRKQFATVELLRDHEDKVHGDHHHIEDQNEEEEQLELGEERDHLSFQCCQFCFRCFRASLDLKNHACPERDKSPSKTNAILDKMPLLKSHNRFICGYCDEEYRQFTRMEYHLPKCDGGPFDCQLCSSSFVKRKSLNEHKTMVHASETPFHCSECPRKFKLNNSLQKHMVNAHEKEITSFKCDKCGKRFVKKVYLTNHQTRFHNLFKPFLCQVCGDRFISSPSLESHMKIHQNVKRFSCQTCKKEFRRRDKLNFHLAVHTGERPHKCSICQKGFIRKSKLQDHIRRHTGEKRFSCLVCNKMYSGSYDLRLHLQRHHPNVGKNVKATVQPELKIVQSEDPVSIPGRSNPCRAIGGKATNVKLETASPATSILAKVNSSSVMEEASKSEQSIEVSEQTEGELFPGGFPIDMEEFNKSSHIAVLDYESVLINQL